MRTKLLSVREIQSADLEAAAGAILGGRAWSFARDGFSHYDSPYLFSGIDGLVSEADQEALAAFAASGRGAYLARALLNRLVALGVIGPGDYLVRVSGVAHPQVDRQVDPA